MRVKSSFNWVVRKFYIGIPVPVVYYLLVLGVMVPPPQYLPTFEITYRPFANGTYQIEDLA